MNTRIKMQGIKKLKANANADQTDQSLPRHITYDNLSDGLIKILKTEGVGALWSGTLPSLVLVSNPAIQFMIFEMLKRNLQQTLARKELSSFHVFTLGAISKSISTVVSYPLQVVQSKKRYGSSEVKNKSMTRILGELVETGTLYKGLEAKLLQTVCTTALMYVFYERIYNSVTKLSKSIY